VVDVAGVSHVFAWGGVHGAVDNYFDEGIILCCDVSSLYPAIMIEYGFLSRNVAEPDKYKKMRDTRLKLKADKNPMQLPYKIVLND
jgi:DNA polymerase elongation subunit (family B)